MPVFITYATHSTTTDNEAGIATGWNPGSLSATGREQARALGKRYRDVPFAAIYVSDLARAMETARLAFGESASSLRPESRLRECNYGDRNGTSVTRADRLAHVDRPFPAGESYRDVVLRMRMFLAHLLSTHRGHDVMLVAHSAPRFALEHLLNGIALEVAVGDPTDWQPGWQYEVPDDLGAR